MCKQRKQMTCLSAFQMLVAVTWFDILTRERLMKIEATAQRIKQWEKKIFSTEDKPTQQVYWRHPLPKLADTDIVTLDVDKKTIQESDRYTTARSYLEEILRLQ